MEVVIAVEQILSVLQKLFLCLKVTFSQEKEISKSWEILFLWGFCHTASATLAEGNIE